MSLAWGDGIDWEELESVQDIISGCERLLTAYADFEVFYAEVWPSRASLVKDLKPLAAADGQRPQPTADDQRPTTNDQRPTANGQQPTGDDAEA